VNRDALPIQSSLKLKTTGVIFGCTKGSQAPRERKADIANSVEHFVVQNYVANLTSRNH